jgi:hypothetical protein
MPQTVPGLCLARSRDRPVPTRMDRRHRVAIRQKLSCNRISLRPKDTFDSWSFAPGSRAMDLTRCARGRAEPGPLHRECGTGSGLVAPWTDAVGSGSSAPLWSRWSVRQPPAKAAASRAGGPFGSRQLRQPLPGPVVRSPAAS